MRDQGFYVQMHLHTAESSRCARVGGADMARACKEAGYDLIVVTDHFFNANTCVPYDMPWDEQVKGLFAGYRAAKAMGDQIGLHVLPGWETYTDGPEYLTYGLGEEFLLHNRDIAILPKKQYLKRVHASGGYITHAHPFREASYIPHFDPDPLVWTRWRYSTAATWTRALTKRPAPLPSATTCPAPPARTRTTPCTSTMARCAFSTPYTPSRKFSTPSKRRMRDRTA